MLLAVLNRDDLTAERDHRNDIAHRGVNRADGSRGLAVLRRGCWPGPPHRVSPRRALGPDGFLA